MLGNFAQIASLLKNAGQIKENMKQAQARLAAARFVGESGGGQVKVTVDGRGEPVTIAIEPSLLTAGDSELVGELTVAALRDAIGRSREAMMKEMEVAAGGINLGGMMDMLGK